VIDYDINIVCPIFLHMFFHVNVIKVAINHQVVVENDDLFFGETASSDDAIMSTLKNELQIYQ
jgi:hypothetical protein